MKINRPILIALFIIAATILTYFFVMPSYRAFKKNQGELSYKKAEYVAKRDYYADITNLPYALQSRKDDIEKIDDALPVGSNFGQLIYYFQKQAADSGLIMKGLFISQSSLANVKKSGGEISLSISLMGFYSALENFLTNLESSSRLFEVTGMSFGSSSPASSTTTSTSKSSSTSSSVAETQFEGDGPRSFSLQIKTHSY
jgi:Tfp pilus assembly protein PilO